MKHFLMLEVTTHVMCILLNLLSMHVVSDDAEPQDFGCSKELVQSHPSTGLQPLYFVARSFSNMKEQLM